MGSQKQDPAEKGLPTNVDAERYVLGAILQVGTLYVEVSSVLELNDFSLEKHRRIFKRMGDLNSRGIEIDRITVAQELMRYAELESVDGLSYLVSLDDGMPATPHPIRYAHFVKEASQRRTIIFAAQHLINRAMVSEESVQEISISARDVLLPMSYVEDGSGPQTALQIVQAIPGGIAELLGPPKRGLQTGFNKYDDYTGGLHAGDLIILAARPSVGKTAMALNIAHHVAVKQQKSVTIFSLEMSKESLLMRMVCAGARVDSQRVRLGYTNREERARLAAALDEIINSKLRIDDTSAASLDEMYARALRQKASEDGLDLLIVDYLQLMSSGRRRFENKNQEVTYISRGLKLMAKELKAAVMALSQLSRAVETRKGGGNRPQLSDLRESGAIEQDSDVVNFIFREEMYTKNREDLRGLAELIIAKQRSGPVGTVNLVFLHNLTKFENRAEDTGDEVPPPMLQSGAEWE